MIVPRTRLLVWVGLIVLPFAFVAGATTSGVAVAAAFIGALFVAAIADAIGARRYVAGVGVELPEVARMSVERAGKLELRIRNARPARRLLSVGLPWPAEIKTETETLDAVLPAESEWSRLVWPCTPLRRGNYRLTQAYVEGTSPLGFWAARKSVPVQGEIRVYPNLLRERKNLAALFLNRGQFGLHAQRQVGKGRDFEKLREYIPGDDYQEIHWKATARRGRPISKVFQIEKTQEVYVVVDASRLSARRAGEEADAESTLERFVTAALVLGLAAEKQGDLFGLVAFSDKVDRFVRAKNGQSHYHGCRDALYTVEPKLVTPDFDELFTFLRLRLRRRALLVFLTALDDPAVAESFVLSLDLIRRQHLILVNMIRPPGVRPLFGNPGVANVDELYEELGGHLRWQKLRELQKVMQRRGARLTLLANERLSADIVSQYLNVKRRQLL